jgi:hypothetical protein
MPAIYGVFLAALMAHGRTPPRGHQQTDAAMAPTAADTQKAHSKTHALNPHTFFQVKSEENGHGPLALNG